MNLNNAEFTALLDPSLPHAAFVLYAKCFRRFMDYKTGNVFLSNSRMIQELEYIPMIRSKDKPISFTREKVATLIKHLVRVELITKVKNGNLKAGISATWHCLQATTDEKKVLFSLNRDNTENTQVKHTADNTVDNTSEPLANKGAEQSNHTADNTADNTEAKPRDNTISGTTVLDIYNAREEKASKKSKTNVKKNIFKPPNYDQVLQVMIDYQLLKNPTLPLPTTDDSESFVDFYTSKGWKVGSAAMKDWGSAAKGWIRRNNEKQKGLNHEKYTKNNNRDYKYQQKGADELFNDPYENVNRLLQQRGG